MPRLALSRGCSQRCTFERNPFILSVLVSRFSFAFVCSVHSNARIFRPSTPLLHTTHHLQAVLHQHFSLVRTLLCGSHQTVWSNKVVWSAPISSHKDANIRLFGGLDLTKFTFCTTSPNTGTMSADKVFATSTSRCKKNSVTITSECFSLTLLTNPLMHRLWLLLHQRIRLCSFPS